jgi:aminotransferase
MLPYHSEARAHLRDFQVCTRCCMDTTDHEIEFDDKGVCNHCKYFDNQLSYYWHPDEKGEKLLLQMVSEVQAYGRGKKYDSIIGLSGGVDSSYLACKVREWGLRPLAVHVDGGWNSELAVKNIEQIVTRVGLDLVTHVVDWEEMRDLQVSFLKSHVANQDSPQDHAFFAALYHFAVKNDIKYVISGSNYATESILPVSWGYDPMDTRHVKAIHKQFGKRPLKTFPLVNFFDFHVYYPMIKGMTVLRPLNLIPYSKEAAIADLEQNYGWRYYGGKHYESRWTRFFQAHYLPAKFGYDKRKAHLASLVVAGLMTRDEALKELEKPLYTDNELSEDKAFVAKKLGLSVDDLNALIYSPPKHYTNYPNRRKLEQRFYTVRDKTLSAYSRLRQNFG